MVTQDENLNQYPNNGLGTQDKDDMKCKNNIRQIMLVNTKRINKKNLVDIAGCSQYTLTYIEPPHDIPIRITYFLCAKNIYFCCMNVVFLYGNIELSIEKHYHVI